MKKENINKKSPNAGFGRYLGGISKLFLEKLTSLWGGGGGGGIACDANFFVLLLNYYSKILLQLCQLYSTSLFVAELDPLPNARVW